MLDEEEIFITEPIGEPRVLEMLLIEISGAPHLPFGMRESVEYTEL
jgi:hypothetical protein